MGVHRGQDLLCLLLTLDRFHQALAGTGEAGDLAIVFDGAVKRGNGGLQMLFLADRERFAVQLLREIEFPPSVRLQRVRQLRRFPLRPRCGRA